MAEEVQPKSSVPKNRKGLRIFLILLIIVLVISAAGIAGFFVFKQLTPAPVVQPAVEPAVVDPTANWHIYDNQEVGFTVKYPEELKELDDTTSTHAQVFTNPFVGETKLLSSHVVESNTGSSRQTFYFLVFDNQFTENTEVTFIDPNARPLGSLLEEVSGVDMYVNENFNITDSSCVYSRAFVAANGRTILMGLESCEASLDFNSTSESSITLFRSVIETFKYDLTKNPAFGWTEWNNAGVGISFKFSKDYRVVSSGVYSQSIENPDFSWNRIILEKSVGNQTASLVIDIDASGVSVLPADKYYTILESPPGYLSIGPINIEESNATTTDGKVTIVSNTLKASNGHTYSWVFQYDEGVKDFEEDFKFIISQFRLVDEFGRTSPKPVVIDNQSWQTYRNEELGFEFQYPAAAVVKNEMLEINDTLELRLLISVSYESSSDCVIEKKCGEGYSITIKILEGVGMDYAISDAAIESAENFSQVFVNGVPGKISAVKSVGQEGGQSQTVFLERGDLMYVIGIYAGAYSPIDTFSKQKIVFDKILSTFKFTK